MRFRSARFNPPHPPTPHCWLVSLETSRSPGDAYRGLMGGEVHYFSNVLGLLIKESPRWLLSHMPLPHNHQVAAMTHRFSALEAHSPNADPVGPVCCCHGSRMRWRIPARWLKNSSLSAVTSMRKVAGTNSSIFSLLRRARRHRGGVLSYPVVSTTKQLQGTKKKPAGGNFFFLCCRLTFVFNNHLQWPHFEQLWCHQFDALDRRDKLMLNPRCSFLRHF